VCSSRLPAPRSRSEPERAVALVAEVCDALHNQRRLVVEEPEAGAWLIRVALNGHDRARADKVATCLEQIAAENPGIAPLRSRASQARALVDRHAGRARRGRRPVTGWASGPGSVRARAVRARPSAGPVVARPGYGPHLVRALTLAARIEPFSWAGCENSP
jgi:hypothetical protein